MKRILLPIIMLALSATIALGQVERRYLEEVFPSVTVTTDVVYGVNATVILLPQLGEAVPQPLTLDLYVPDGDTETDRPLVVMFHTGNFIPNPQNGSTTGTKEDSANVEVAMRLAKMGYVVANATYRMGWNPIATTQTERVFTLINAAYRGVQDARTAAKYFRRSVAEMSNPYGIDPSKIVIWGIGTGGYISLNTAFLDDYMKIPLTPGGKFVTVQGGNPIPMVIESINGDLNADSVGIVPPGYPGFPAGDTLNYPNHVGYSGDYQLAVNMGGALGDSSWMNAGQMPVISYHVPTDPFAPYDIGIVIVPGLNLPVVEIAGSYRVQLLAQRYNLNAAFAGKTYVGDHSATANSRNDGYDGLFPVIGTIPDDSAPWAWWDTAHVNHSSSLQTNPDMSGAKARRYIDSIIDYFAPRACEVLALGCQFVGIDDAPVSKGRIHVFPVPAQQAVEIRVDGNTPIRSLELFDITGRLVMAYSSVNRQHFTLPRGATANGQYLLRIRMDDRVETRTIMFQ